VCGVKRSGESEGRNKNFGKSVAMRKSVGWGNVSTMLLHGCVRVRAGVAVAVAG
jgi:hypothetical protein